MDGSTAADTTTYINAVDVEIVRTNTEYLYERIRHRLLSISVGIKSCLEAIRAQIIKLLGINPNREDCTLGGDPNISAFELYSQLEDSFLQKAKDLSRTKETVVAGSCTCGKTLRSPCAYQRAVKYYDQMSGNEADEEDAGCIGFEDRRKKLFRRCNRCWRTRKTDSRFRHDVVYPAGLVALREYFLNRSESNKQKQVTQKDTSSAPVPSQTAVAVNSKTLTSAPAKKAVVNQPKATLTNISVRNSQLDNEGTIDTGGNIISANRKSKPPFWKTKKNSIHSSHIEQSADTQVGHLEKAKSNLRQVVKDSWKKTTSGVSWTIPMASEAEDVGVLDVDLRRLEMMKEYFTLVKSIDGQDKTMETLQPIKFVSSPTQSLTKRESQAKIYFIDHGQISNDPRDLVNPQANESIVLPTVSNSDKTLPKEGIHTTTPSGQKPCRTKLNCKDCRKHMGTIVKKETNISEASQSCEALNECKNEQTSAKEKDNVKGSLSEGHLNKEETISGKSVSSSGRGDVLSSTAASEVKTEGNASVQCKRSDGRVDNNGPKGDSVGTASGKEKKAEDASRISNSNEQNRSDSHQCEPESKPKEGRIIKRAVRMASELKKTILNKASDVQQNMERQEEVYNLENHSEPVTKPFPVSISKPVYEPPYTDVNVAALEKMFTEPEPPTFDGACLFTPAAPQTARPKQRPLRRGNKWNGASVTNYPGRYSDTTISEESSRLESDSGSDKDMLLSFGQPPKVVRKYLRRGKEDNRLYIKNADMARFTLEDDSDSDSELSSAPDFLDIAEADDRTSWIPGQELHSPPKATLKQRPSGSKNVNRCLVKTTAFANVGSERLNVAPALAVEDVTSDEFDEIDMAQPFERKEAEPASQIAVNQSNATTLDLQDKQTPSKRVKPSDWPYRCETSEVFEVTSCYREDCHMVQTGTPKKANKRLVEAPRVKVKRKGIPNKHLQQQEEQQQQKKEYDWTSYSESDYNSAFENDALPLQSGDEQESDSTREACAMASASQDEKEKAELVIEHKEDVRHYQCIPEIIIKKKDDVDELGDKYAVRGADNRNKKKNKKKSKGGKTVIMLGTVSYHDQKKKGLY